MAEGEGKVERPRALEWHVGDVTSAGVSAGGSHVVCASLEETVLVWQNTDCRMQNWIDKFAEHRKRSLFSKVLWAVWRR